MVPKYIQQAILSPELEQEISTSHHSPQFSTFKCAPNPFENLSPKQKEEWMLNRGHMLDHNLSQSSGTPPTEVGENYHDKTPQLSTQPSAKVLKHGFVKRPWTLEEDQKLATFVKREGVGKWKQAATLIFGRTGKQCRERWLNNLNPDVRKGNWTPEEDQIITELYEKYGSKWTQIAKHIPGRTENSIKNRFYCALRNPATVKRRNQIEAMGFERSKLENALTQELKKHSDDLEDCVVKHEPPVSYGAGFDSNCLHDNAQMWAVKEEGEEENTSLLVKEEPQTKSSAIKRFFANKDKMVNLPVQNEKVVCNVKTETENVLKSTTLQKILLPIDCPVYNNNFFTKNCDDFQANLLNKFSSTPVQRTLGCPDQEIHDHRSAFKVMSANGATQLFRHDIGFKDSSLHNQPKNQAPQMQHYYPPQAHTLPVTLMQNQQQEGLPMCQIQELRIQQQQQQQQQQRQISRLNAFQFQDAPLKALDFSTRTQTQENNCLLMPLKNSHCFSGVSETNLQSLGLEHLMKFEALRRHEETHANRKVDENLANMMRALSNKIERVSLVYTHYMKQIQEAGESHNYTKDETCALFQKVAGLNRWLTQAKGELRKLEAVSHTQKSGSYMNNEMMNTINATTNKRSLIDYDLSGTGWDQIIKKRK